MSIAWVCDNLIVQLGIVRKREEVNRKKAESKPEYLCQVYDLQTVV